MKLEMLSDSDLHSRTIRAADEERAATTTLLHHLIEIQRRKLFAQYSCASLFDYCVKILLMSEPQASRRVNAARLLGECPAIEDKINSGELSLTAVSQAQVFFRKEKRFGVELNSNEKMELIERLESKSTREVEKILVSYASEPISTVNESVRAISTSLTELKFAVDSETLASLERLKELWSHELPGASLADVISKAVKIARKKADPLLNITRRVSEEARSPSLKKRPTKKSTPTPAPELKGRSENNARSRYISSSVRRLVWKRDEGSCSFIDQRGERCGSRHFIQLDHVRPFALGGSNTLENLRLLCSAHNQARVYQANFFR